MATTTNYGWTTPNDTDLVKDGAAAIRTLGSSIDTTTKALNPSTTLGDIEYRSSTANTNTRLPIGTSGQFLSVVGGVPAWAALSDVTPLTTKGDLFTFTTVDARLGVGANGTVLQADSAEATGLKWVTPSAGKLLQVVQATYSTENSTTSSSYVATGLSVSITPTSATSKILVLVSQQYLAIGTAPYCLGTISLFRDSTLVLERKDDAHGLNVAGSGDRQVSGISAITYLDSPATTSAISYNTQMKVNQTTFRTQHTGSTSSIVCIEIGA